MSELESMEERQLNGPVSGHGGSEHSGSVLDEDDLHGLSFADCAELLALTPEEVSKSPHSTMKALQAPTAYLLQTRMNVQGQTNAVMPQSRSP